MKSKKRQERVKGEQKLLVRRILACVAAMGVSLLPGAAEAQSITKGADFTTITTNGNVTDVTTSKVYGGSVKIGVNVFNTFQLDANQIANLYFGTKEANTANKLVNFVDTRIDVNGTVNAVQNNKIGGELYFLSRDGMAVGASGVINTGSLYVMTPVSEIADPTSPFNYAMLKGEFSNASATPGSQVYDNTMTASIPLNASGTITVLGKINATDNIGLHAPKIAVGRNISGEAVGTVADGGVVTTAKLTTGVVDFKDLVNLTGIDSGLTPANLVAVRAADGGDIVIAAKAEYANTIDQAFNNIAVSELGITEGIIDPDIIPRTVTASVENYGEISAARDAVMTVTATNGNIEKNDASSFGNVKAVADVQGDVAAGNDVVISAVADNTYLDRGSGMASETFGAAGIQSLLGATIASIDANVMILGSEAEVTVGQQADITAGNKVKLNAESTLDATAGVSVTGSKLYSVTSLVPSAGVSYAQTSNKASVNVAGKVTAGGAASTEADADKTIEITASAVSDVSNTASTAIKKSVTNAEPSALVVGIAITKTTNEAETSIAEGAQIGAASGDIKINAVTDTGLLTTAAASAPDASMATAAINYVGKTTAANVEVAGKVSAGSDIAVKAENVISDSSITANNSIGMSKMQAELTGKLMQAAHVEGITNAVKGLVPSSVTDKLSFLKGESGTEPSPLDNLFSAGASVVVANEHNASGVKISAPAEITAGGNLDIAARTAVLDTFMHASAKTNSFKKDAEKDVTIAAAVVYADVNNDAVVEVAGGTMASHPKLSGRNTNIRSSTVMEYNRVSKLIEGLQNSVNQLNDAIAAIENLDETKKAQYEDLLSGLVNIKTKLLSCMEGYGDDFHNAVDNPDAITAEGGMEKIFATAATGLGVLNELRTLQEQFDALLDVTSPVSNVVNSALGIVTSALAFTEPSSYANFSAGATSMAGPETTFSAAGSVTVTDVDHNSRVIIGRNSEITAAEKVTIGSANTIEDVNITGKNKFWKGDAAAGGGVGIGGSFNYQNFDTNSLVLVGAGAAIEGGDIAIASDNGIFHVGAMLSAGKSDGSAITGMVGMTEGDSVNIVSVDDEASLTATADATGSGGIEISATNDTSATNATVAVAASGDNAAVGMGVAINNFDVVNIASVGNNDGKQIGGIDTAAYFAYPDDWAGSAVSPGRITGSALNVTAETTGLINAVSVAGGVTSSGSSGDDEEKKEEGFLDKVKAPYTKLVSAKDKTVSKLDSVAGKLQGTLEAMGSGSEKQGGGDMTEEGAAAGTPSFSIAGAGSASVNLVENTTKAILSDATVEIKDGGNVTVGARDAAFTGAWSGAAGMSFRKGSSEDSGTSVAVAGAVALNQIDNTVEAKIANTRIDEAGSIDVAAVSGGTQIAAGIGATLTKDSTQGANYSGGGSVSVNIIDKNVSAVMADALVDGGEETKTDVDVTAYESDVQVAGGVTANIALGGGKVAGGSVAVADVKNTVNAELSGGSYQNVGDVSVKSMLGVTQVTAALSAGIAVGGSAGSNLAFEGAVVYNGLDNDVKAAIAASEITGANRVSVRAKDIKPADAEAAPYQDLLGSYAANKSFAENRGIAVDGKEYYENIDTSSTGLSSEERGGNGAQGVDAVDLSDNGKTGSTIVGAAFVVAGSDNAAGAAVNIADIDNDFAATIGRGAQIEAGSTIVGADADTLLINAAGGVAAGKDKFGGMGTVTWQNLDNDVFANIEQSAITTDILAVKAENSALNVNVGGQVAYGGKAGVGAVLAYNALDNTVGSYVKGSAISAENTADGSVIEVEAVNESAVYGIGASVAASPKAAISGTVVINRGGSNTEAVIDQYSDDTITQAGSITDVNHLGVRALDRTKRTAVVGNVSASGKVAVGAGIAYNDIGGASADTSAASQNTLAQINDTSITTAGENAAIDLHAEDTSELLTIGVGIGGAGNVAVQGAAAAALVNKTVEASITNAEIDREAAKNAEVSVRADSDSDILTVAAVLAVSKEASIGAAASVNRIEQDTKAFVSSGSLNLQNLELAADSAADILNVSIGGAGAMNVAIAGNAAVNLIGNDTTASIDGGTVVDSGSDIIVEATSGETLENYAGTGGFAAGGYVGIGLSSVVNEITGSTKALVNQAALDSEGGIAVTADSTHNMRNALVTAGAAAGGSVSVGAAATVAVNKLEGETEASIRESDLNRNKTSDFGNIKVEASDYGNIASTLGNVAAGIGADGGGAVGEAVDTIQLSRDVTAVIDGNDSAGNIVNAAKMLVSADAEHIVSTTAIGASVSGGIYGSLSIAGTTSLTKVGGTVKSGIYDIVGKSSGFDVLANRSSDVELNGVAGAISASLVGVAAGMGVGVVNDEGVTEAEVVDSTLNNASAAAMNTVKAENTTKLAAKVFSGSIGTGAATGGTVVVNNINSNVKAAVLNSTIGTKYGSANGSFKAEAINNIDADFHAGQAVAGLAGGSAAVGVGINTIDSSVVVDIEGSRLFAENIELSAAEHRNIDQYAINASAGMYAVGANILVTNVGAQVQNLKDSDGNANSDVDKSYENVASAIGNQDGALSADNTFGALDEAGVQDTSSGVMAGRGGLAAEGVQVVVASSEVAAKQAILAGADETDDISLTAGSAVVGKAAFNAGIGVMNVEHKTGITLDGTTLAAPVIALETASGGSTRLDMYQGTGGVFGVTAAYGLVKTSGSNTIAITDSALTGNEITAAAGDNGSTEVNAVGITGGLIAAGVIVAQAENESATAVNITDSDLKEQTSGSATSKINISAEKANQVLAHAAGGAVGAAALNGVVATAKDTGRSELAVTDNSFFKAGSISLEAANKPAVKALADSATLSYFVSGGASVATAAAEGFVDVSVRDGRFEGDTVSIKGSAGTQDSKNTAEAKVIGLGGSLYGAAAANVATARSNMTVDVEVANNRYKQQTVQVEDGFEWQDLGDGTGRRLVPIYKTTQVGLSDLLVQANNATKTKADTKGLTVGGLFASGNNVAVTENNSETTVSVTGKDTEGSLVKNMFVAAAGSADNKAYADGSGGAMFSGDLAGYAKNTMTSDTIANIDGVWNVSGDLTVQALHGDTANVNADALKAAVVGASATVAENTIKNGSEGGTSVRASGATITGGGNVAMTARNNITIGNEEPYGVEGSGYGGIAVKAAVMDNEVTKTARVDLGNAYVLSQGEQSYAAQTVGNLNVGGYIKAAGAGAFSIVAVDNDVAETNSVNAGSGSYLKTTGAGSDINMFAVDDIDIRVIGVADTQGGAVGGASSNVGNSLTRTNKVNVDGHLYSMNNVNLTAGGNASELDLVLSSEAYNKTALAVSVPTYGNRLQQNGQVTVGPGGNIESVAHIAIAADNGQQTVRETSYMYTWYYSEKNENYASTTVGDSDIPSSHTNNFVQIDGSLMAGVQNKQHITIGGDGQIVILDPDTLSAAQAVPGQEGFVGSEGLELDYSSGVDGSRIEVGTLDYGNALFKRYQELGKLFAEYSERASTDSSYSAAALGYRAEQQRIFNEMQDMGLVYEATDGAGNKFWTVIPGITVDFISIPDIIASGGDIGISSDNLQGSGSMTAKGAPEITVTNNTNLYMKVNDLVVGDAGGTLSFNGVDLVSADYRDKIRDINKNKSANVAVTATASDTAGGGFISVIGNYGGGKIYADTVEPGTTQTVRAEMTPRADIEINGNLENMNGTIDIESKSNNIVIQGETADSSASVDGKTVNITASNGSVSQGYTDGIVNVGGSVEAQYAGEYQSLKNYYDATYPGTVAGNVHQVGTTANNAKAYGNRIAGGRIYINASDINVNGYIQSGYADYELNVDAGVQGAIDIIRNKWLSSGSAILSDALVTTGTAYRISVSGNALNTDGTYRRNVDAYYNPSTDRIVVPDVDAKGGQVYLTGRISSTGNGRIVVLDGAADINVINNTSTALQVGNLISNDVEGLISIADTGRKRMTEIRRDSTTVKDLTRWDDATDDWKLISTGGTSASYSPLTGLRYNWTKGQSTVAKRTYENTIKAGLWGAVETMNNTEMSKYEVAHPTNPSALTTNPKTNGSFIGGVNVGGYANNDFVMIYDKITTENSRTNPTVERWSSGFLGWFKWERWTWSTTTGTSQQYVSSVKADKPISIGFIGSETGAVDVTSKAGIDLTGSIKANNGSAVINVTSTQGSINQKSGSITGDNVNLNAVTGIENIKVNSLGDTVNLTAVNSGSGDVDVTVSGAYGKQGNVNIGSVSAASGAAALTADGNIVKTGLGTAVTADRIDLVSKRGGIGTSGKALVVQGGQEIIHTGDTMSASVNAFADKDINLEQASGNLRLGRAYSTQGDVTLTINSGDLLDALPEGETVERGSAEELIRHWQDLGLVEGDGAYKEKQAIDVANYKDSVNAEFAVYREQKTYYSANNPIGTADAAAAYSDYNEAKGVCGSLQGEFAAYQSQAVYYNDASNLPIREKYRSQEAYESALSSYQSGKAAFDQLQLKCSGYFNADEYVQAQAPDAYASYTNPLVEGQSLKQAFDSYSNYETLAARYGAYATAEGFLGGAEAQGVIASLEQEGANWSANALLYAVQDSIINPASGSTDNVIKDPNIRAQNIVVNAAGGSVGQNSPNTTTIQLAGLSDRVDDLKKLANANASDVTWNAALGIATISEKTPLGIQLNNNGAISVDATNNVYLSGRTQDNAYLANAFNLVGLNAGGDIRLQGSDGVFNSASGPGAVISGKNLLLQGGNGALGTAEKPLTLDLDGSLQAQSKGGIYLEALGTLPMRVVSVGAGGDIVLTSEDDIVSEDLADTAAQGNIRSDNGKIVLSAAGDIGTAGQGLRIKNVNPGNTEQTVSAKAQNIYLEGVSTDISVDAMPQGVLYLAEIKSEKTGGGTIAVTDNGSAVLQGSLANSGINGVTTIQAASDITVNNDINAADGRVVLSAEGNLDLNAGTLRAADANLVAAAVRDPLSPVTTSGAITQSADQIIIAPKLVAVAANGIDLDNPANLLGEVDVWNMGAGDIAIGSGSSDGLTVILEKKNDGAVTIHNYDNEEHKKTQLIVASQIEANGDASFINDNGDLITARAATVETANNGTLTNEFGVKTTKKVFMQATNGEIYNTMDISSIIAPAPRMMRAMAFGSLGSDLTENTIDMVSTTGIHNLGNVTSTVGHVYMTATDGSSIINEKAVTAAQDVKMAAGGEIINKGDVTSGTNMLMQAGTNIVNAGNLTSSAVGDNEGKAIELTAETGSITNTGSTITAADGDILLSAKGSDAAKAFINNGSAINAATGSVTLEATGDIVNTGGVTSGLMAGLTSTSGSITNSGAVNAIQDAMLMAAGSINNSGSVNAGRDIGLTAANGDISSTAALNAGQNINAAVTNKGNIFFGAGAVAQNGDIGVTTNEGNITSSHIDEDPEAQDVKLSALNGSVALYTKKGDIDFHALYAANTASAATDAGNITICSIDGDIVLLSNLDMNGQTSVKDVTVGSKLGLNTNLLTIGSLKQREGSTSMFLISPNSSRPDEPIGRFAIGSIEAPNGVRIDKLWAREAEVHVDGGKFHIDKLSIVDVAHFSNRDMTTAVYGLPPLRDGSDSIFWNNAEDFNPKNALADWQREGYIGNWMNLYFTDSYHMQISNGVLAGLEDYYYVYNQRFSGDNHLAFLERNMPYGTYKAAYTPEYSYFERFALYELPEVPGEETGPELLVEEEVL